LKAVKGYGVFQADSGGNRCVPGESKQGRSASIDGLVTGRRGVRGSDFEVVHSGRVSTNRL